MRKELDCPPLVLETHGGAGKLFDACFADVAEGVVFETAPAKAALLALQRPGWRVYEAPSEVAIAAGVADDLPFNLLDCDPYGDPWPVLRAFWEQPRSRGATLAVVVNDGLRQKIKLNGGWDVASIEPVISQFGASGLHDRYLDACRWFLAELAGHAGYAMARWTGYYTGHALQMTHYAAVFTSSGGAR